MTYNSLVICESEKAEKAETAKVSDAVLALVCICKSSSVMIGNRVLQHFQLIDRSDLIRPLFFHAGYDRIVHE